MLITYREDTVRLAKWDSESELTLALSTCTLGSIVLGTDQEYPSRFYSAIIQRGWSKANTFGIGILSEWHGVEPCIILQPDLDRIILGFNQQVVAISIDERKVVYSHNLFYLFFFFVELTRQRLILIRHETGVTCLDWDGNVKWQYGKDIVTDMTLNGDDLTLKFMDSSMVKLHLSDGAITQTKEG